MSSCEDFTPVISDNGDVMLSDGNLILRNIKSKIRYQYQTITLFIIFFLLDNALFTVPFCDSVKRMFNIKTIKNEFSNFSTCVSSTKALQLIETSENIVTEEDNKNEDNAKENIPCEEKENDAK